MARLPRLYRVVGTWPDGSTKTRRYLTPDAAREREVRWREATPPPVSITTTPSHPVTWPHALGDSTTFDLPDAIAPASDFRALAAWLGLSPDAILAIHVVTDENGRQLVVEYEGDPAHPGRRAPKLWRVQIESE